MAAVIKASNESPLTAAQLVEFQQRAAVYDRENTFFTEDWETLRESGYLLMPVPEELGGLGYSLAEVAAEQRRLAYYAPADALAVNMHFYWVGVAADLWRQGDLSCEWMLREAAAGEVFAAGHAEPQGGYDHPALYANTKARRVDGGYCFTGRKCFGSLTPVWTRLGLHGVDDSDPDNPKIVHAFMARDAEGYEIVETWDTLGMRATQSQDTVLDSVFVPDKYIPRVIPAGFAGADAFILSIFAWALTGFANVYCGLARSAFDRVVASVGKKKVNTMLRSYAWHAEVQHAVAEMAMKLEGIEALLDRTAADWSDGVDHGGMWPAKIVGTKCHVVENAWQVVDKAFELAGGFAVFKASPWERILRDARLGLIHPANGALAREIVAKSHLGLDLDEQPRWG